MSTDPTPAARERDRTILRYAVGVALTFALSLAYAWPASFAAPVFCGLFVTAPRPISLRGGLTFLLVLYGAMLAGYVLTGLLTPYPLLLVAAIFAGFYATYYYATGGPSVLYLLAFLIGVTVMPVLGFQSLESVIPLRRGLFGSGLVALLVSWVAFALLPAAPAGAAPPRPAAPPTAVRHERALAATLLAAPLALAFIFFEITSLLVLILSMFFIMFMSRETGVGAGYNMLAANLVGGAAAVVIYLIVLAAPFTPLVLLLVLLSGFLFGRRMLSDHPAAAASRTAANGFLIVLGASLVPDGMDASAKYITRVIQLLLVVAYVAIALTVLEYFKARRQATQADRATDPHSAA